MAEQITLKVPGQKFAEPKERIGTISDVEEIVPLEHLASFTVEAARGEEARASEIDLPEDAVVEIELENGIRLWRAADFTRDDPVAYPARGEGDEALDIPRVLPVGASERSRGLGSFAVRTLRFFKVDIVDTAAETAAVKLARKIESQLHNDGQPGLYRCETPFELEELNDAVPTDRKILIFLHGTASSTKGSFGNLAGTDGSPTDHWQGLKEKYGKHIYALEHKTLTESPIENAILLLQALPARAQIDLVSHSRGGLVGELLARSGAKRLDDQQELLPEAEQPDPIDKVDHEIFASARSDDDPQQREKDRRDLETLNRLLLEKRPTVDRFVRVGCPARGTTLASGRLDLYLSVILNLIGAIPGIAQSVFYDYIKAFTLAVAKTRTRPETIPGLEAQMPESPLVGMLNRQDLRIDSTLAVIAGDVEPSGFLGSLATFATDLYYWADHDYVVNTRAMVGGAVRDPLVRYYFDKGGDVNHFSYFKNRRTAEKLVAALTGDDLTEAGFRELTDRGQELIPRGSIRRWKPGEKPVAVILPGIMGSHLKVGNNRIWLDYFDLLRGRLDRLKRDKPDILPDGAIDDYYVALMKFLSNSHDIREFAYDWRLPVADEAERFGGFIDELLRETEKPVRIVAHSMGGLVARSMIARMPQVWNAMKKRDGCRLVMLGTPNGGAFSMASGILGIDATIRKLALLDVTRDLEEVLTIVSGMQGVLDLLPHDEEGKYLRNETWRDLHDADGRGWVVPDEAHLRLADDLRLELGDPETVDAKRMCYIAGLAPATPVGIDLVDDPRNKSGKRIRMLATAQGDGRVPWSTGRLDGVPTYYADAQHGDLAREPTNFPAILDLLQDGATTRLPDTPPVAVRGLAALFEMPVEPVYPPDRQDFRNFPMGGAERRLEGPSADRPRVTIVHGNLAFSRHPVAVGHYIDDPLMGPEWYLDKVLDGRLTRRRDLGRYPGPRDTVEVVFNDGPGPAGAVVIGLGRFGELWPETLSHTIASAMVEYALRCSERSAARSDEPTPVKLCTLIIGHRESRLTTRDSVLASLDALILANQRLNSDRIVHLQFVELYEDTAVTAADILRKASGDTRYAERLDIDPRLGTMKGGRRRLKQDVEPNWVQRIQVLRSELEGEENTLVFTILTDRALAERDLKLTDRCSIDRFIDTDTATTSSSEQFGQVLFEMLIPQRLKEFSSEGRPILLILDDETAHYPWEMLDDKFADSDEPIALRSSVMRQLVQEEFTPTFWPASRGRVLVVGDPKSSFPELKGAQREAVAVHRLFLERGWKNPRLLNKPSDAGTILKELFLGDFQAVHLAGHGVYEYGDKQVSGMVLGDNVFLTPNHIKSLRRIPEFVFLNCCHLGKIERLAPDSEKAIFNSRHRLAANLASEFIRNGAKAVVAAGWEVDDAAAMVFARTLYTAMLDGEEFGEAAKNARIAARDSNPSRNTWGAYQCYGDPAYRVTPGSRSSGAGDDMSFVAVQQAIIELQTIVQDAGSTTAYTGVGRLQSKLDKVMAGLRRHPAWFADAGLLAALGEAHGEVDRFAEAVDFYRRAIAASRAEAPIRAIEQMANMQVRLAAQLARSDSGNKEQAEELVEDAIDRLEKLNCIAGDPIQTAAGAISGSSERYGLIGGAYKRLALIRDNRSRSALLKRMRQAYDNACMVSIELDGELDPHPAINRMTVDLLLDLRQNDTERQADSALLTQLRQTVLDRDAVQPEFWNLSMLVDAELYRQMSSGRIDDWSVDLIIDGYRRAWRRGGSTRELQSIAETLEFLSEMLRVTRRTKNLPAMREAIGRIRKSVIAMAYERD